MAEYSTDHDITDLRPDILKLGRGDFSHLHLEAKELIDRDLKVEWYLPSLGTRIDRFNIVHGIFSGERDTFDPQLFLNPSEFKRLSSFKTLELIYRTFEKELVGDPFAEQADRFEKRYKDELHKVVRDGITYDWDKDGSVDKREKDRRVFQTWRMVRG